MERQFAHSQSRSFFLGKPRFHLSVEISLTDQEYQAASDYRLLDNIVFSSVDLPQRKKEGVYAWVSRLLIASLSGQIIRLNDLISGVSFTSKSVSEINFIEETIEINLVRLHAQILSSLHYDGEDIAVVGDRYDQ